MSPRRDKDPRNAALMKALGSLFSKLDDKHAKAAAEQAKSLLAKRRKGR